MPSHRNLNPPPSPSTRMPDTPLDKKVAVVFAGALAFGLYCSTFLTCLRWLLCADEGWKARKNIRWPVVVVSGLIFVFNALYLIWDLHWGMARVWHAINDPPGTPTFQTPESASIVSVSPQVPTLDHPSWWLLPVHFGKLYCSASRYRLGKYAIVNTWIDELLHLI